MGASSSGGGGGVNSIGSMDAQAQSVNGASVSGTSLFMQSASSSSGGAGVGLVNTVAQPFLGTKTFVSSPIIAPLAGASLVFTNATGQLTSGSVSLTTQVSGVLPSGNLPPLSGITGSISLTSQVSGVLPVLNGGTGSQLSTGSGSVVLSSTPALSNPTVTTQTQNDNSTKAASTAYVDLAVANAVAGVNPAIAVQAATIGSGDTSSFTYNNGASGIGAFFTGSVNTPVVVDGFTFTALGQRLLVKNDTQSPAGAFNGIYYVTQVQTGILAPILTRALDYNQPSDMNNTGAIPVINGTVNGTTQWVLTSQVVTVGTTPLTFTKFSGNPATYLTGSVSLTAGVSGVLPNANMSSVALGNSSQVTGSISLTNQVSGLLPLTNTSIIPIQSGGQSSGSISLITQVVGVLPTANMSAIAITGSVTQTSSVSGALYTVSWPGSQGSSGTFLGNNGSGGLSWGSPLVYSTAQTTSSGTSFDFTGIPSGTKQINVSFFGVSTNGTNVPQIQLGIAGGAVSSTYTVIGTGFGAGVGSNNYTTGFSLGDTAIATNALSGTMVFTSVGSSNLWLGQGMMYRSTAPTGIICIGSIALPGVLTQIHIHAGGDAFDAGTINVSYI